MKGPFRDNCLSYRQARAAVLKGLPDLKKNNIKTERPPDYFAEMLKSDDHMEKIRKKVIQKALERENIAKLKKLREQKKFSKQIKIQSMKNKKASKKEHMSNLKKFKKGKINLDFLEKSKGSLPVASQKRKVKDKKFGGGRSKIKKNTKASYEDAVNFTFTPSGKAIRKKTPRSKASNKSVRPGKKRRIVSKNKRR